MKTVYDTIQAVRQTSSSLGKLEILTAAKGDADLRAYLRMTYEPRVNFYVKNVQPELITKSMIAPGEVPFTDDILADVYDTIAKRDLTGGAARRWLATLYHGLDKQGKELLTLLIQRDVKAGISVGTINKVWPGLVTDVPYMRCCLPKDTDLSQWPWASGIFSQIKADGMFANVSYHEKTGTVTIESRAGSPFPSEYFKDLIEEVKKTIQPGMQMHGELLMMKAGKLLPREVGNGAFNSLLKEGELEKGLQPVYHVWDMIPVAEAKVKNKYNVPYKTRFKSLVDTFAAADAAGLKHTHLTVIEYEVVHSLAEAYEHCRAAMKRGLEGTVIKHPGAIWEDTTSKFQVKLKLEFQVELLVVGTRAADVKSKNASTFGSLLCQSSCGKLLVGVTGIKDAKRKEIHDNLADWVGKKIITVTANGIMAPTAETGGYHSLFLPRFTDERLDKTQADSLERIQEIQQAAIEARAALKK